MIALPHETTVPVPHHVLMASWSDYRRPKDKLARAVAAGDWIPLRRGWYVSGRLPPQSLELPVVANSLWGPSYVSLDYALSHYGLIPEGVTEVTSVTTRRSHVFQTPVGRFSYQHLPLACYAVGQISQPTATGIGYMMASPEKALCDKLLLTRHLQVSSPRAMARLLFDDLRIDETLFLDLRTTLVQQVVFSGHKQQVLSVLLKLMEAQGCRS